MPFKTLVKAVQQEGRADFGMCFKIAPENFGWSTDGVEIAEVVGVALDWPGDVFAPLTVTDPPLVGEASADGDNVGSEAGDPDTMRGDVPVEPLCARICLIDGLGFEVDVF